MVRFKPIKNAKYAEKYYAMSDGGYYLEGAGLHREFGGKGARTLGLADPDFEQFKALLHGFDPHSGEQLTAKLVDGRIAAWDITASMPKGVTIALERGDSRVHEIMWAANRKAMSDIECYIGTRVRKGGVHDDRVTGNGVWYSKEDAETRPVEDQRWPEGHPWRLMPDMDRHIHNVLFNLTDDAVEGGWKAVKFRPIMDIRRYFDRRFDHYLSGMLADAGYEIETEWRADKRGAPKYYSWDINGIPDSVTREFSRRSVEVEKAEQAVIDAILASEGEAPAHLSPVARDALGATSRHQKRGDLTLDDLRENWSSRISADDAKAIDETIRRAVANAGNRQDTAADAVTFAIGHHFEQESAVRLEWLAATAMERSMGRASPEGIDAELRSQGLIIRMVDGIEMATTPAIRDEERAIAAFALSGQGAVRPIGVAKGLDRSLDGGKSLNDGQWRAVKGLLNSPNRVNVIEGPAGAGKSELLKKFDQGARLAGQGVTYLATTTDAAKVLRKDGFEVNTVARFLLDEKLQRAAMGGRLVVDETSLLGHQDAHRLVQLAGQLDLKLVFVGDGMQHESVPRGATMRVLQEYGGVLPFRLKEIMRQEQPEFRAAVELLSKGQTLEGFDAIDRMGWVEEIGHAVDRYRQIAADYVQAVNDGKSVLVVSPTHAEAARITADIRAQLRDAGKIGAEDRETLRLVPVNASEAERREASTYRPGDVLQFYRNAKGFKIGERLIVTDPAAVPLAEASKFQLYRPEAVALAEGDRIRFTATVKTLDGEHKLENGTVKMLAGFTGAGDFVLDNGWVVSRNCGHFRHGFVDTSFGSQGKTVQRAILAMTSESLPATNQEQMYVSASRAKERLTLYTDDKQAVREAVQRSSRKLAALDILPNARPEAERTARRREQADRRRRLAYYEPRRPAGEQADRQRREQERQAGYGR